MALLGDVMDVSYERHHLNGCRGKVVGIRGKHGDNDVWILLYVPARGKSYLVPASMLTPVGE